MASGFFLGGAAEGMKDAAELGLKKDALAQELGLKTRGLDIQQQTADQGDRRLGQELDLKSRALDIQERSAKNAESRALFTQVDGQISSTMQVITETIKAAQEANKDPAVVAKAIAPLVESAKRLSTLGGRDASAIDAQVFALAARPTGTETATAKGSAAGTEAVVKQKTMTDGGMVDENAGFKDKGQRVEAENKLRDDFMKNSQQFITARDYYRSFQQADDTGAGDITRVFAFMKTLDPGSAVMPGEQANAANAGGVPEAVRAQYNKLVGGGTLGQGARKQLSDQIEKLYTGRKMQQDETTKQFTDIAKRQKLNPKDVIINLDSVGGNRVASSFDDLGLPPPPKGFQIVR